MATFFLIRHGETEWNHDNNRYCGHTDINLSAIGERQAETVALQLKKITFDGIYTSPLKRAVITSNYISSYQTCKPIKDSRLMEIDFGIWEGKTREEIIQEHPRSWQRWIDNPYESQAGVQGESAEDVFNRALCFFKEKAKQHKHQKVLITGHNTFNRILLIGLSGLPFNKYRMITQNNTGVSIFNYDENDQFEIIQLNSIMHLY